MRLVFGLVLILGLGLAGGAVYMAKNYIQGYQAQLDMERAQRAPAIETVDIYVADKPLKYGEVLREDSVRITSFPKQSLPEGTYETYEALFPEGDDEPRTVLRAMEKNEAVIAVKVTGPGEDAGLTSQLERGKRAFAINVDVSSGVSGFLRPGDRVDVYWTGNISDKGARTSSNATGDVTKLIETAVKIIAVDQMANGDTAGAIIARTVTVSVSPQQVAALAQAQTTGRLALSLVGAEDDTVAEAVEVDQRRLLGLQDIPVAEAPVQKQICTIKTRRGGETVASQIPCTN